MRGRHHSGRKHFRLVGQLEPRDHHGQHTPPPRDPNDDEDEGEEDEEDEDQDEEPPVVREPDE